MTKIGKLRKFKMADGRQFENVLFSISSANHPIPLKFGLQTRILISAMAT